MAIAIATTPAEWTPRTRADWLAWLREKPGRGRLLRRIVTEELVGIRTAVVTARPRRGGHDWEVLSSWIAGQTLAEIATAHGFSDAKGAQKALERIITRVRIALRMDRREAIILGEKPQLARGRSGRTVNERSAQHSATRAGLLSSIRERLDRLSARFAGSEGHSLSRVELAELDARLAELER
jgi:hypothetical protein